MSAKFPLWGVVGSDLGSYWRGCLRRQDAVVNCGSEMSCREFSLSLVNFQGTVDLVLIAHFSLLYRGMMDQTGNVQYRRPAQVIGHENFRFQVSPLKALAIREYQ